MDLIIIRTNCPCCGKTTVTKVLACKDYTVSNEFFEIWECSICTIRFTQQVPPQDFIGKYYASDTYISHSDTGKGLINKLYKIARNYTINWKMKLVKEFLGKSLETRSLLDIGAGTGAFLHKASVNGLSVTGLEPDEGARKICKTKYGLELEVPDKLFVLPTESFEAVTMWHVLEHVHQLHEYLDEIKRVLKPNGVAIIALPNYTSRDAGFYKEYWAAYDVPRHLYHFSPLAMGELAERHKMKIDSIKPMWLDAFYISLLSEEYKAGRGNISAAVWNGLRSNMNALKNKGECSSLVYIIRHGKPKNVL